MLSGWWLPEKFPNLSQGDVVARLPLGIPTSPLIHLSKKTLSGNQSAWVEGPPNDDSESGFLLIKTRRLLSIVLTHDCQLDKSKRKPRVQLAPVIELDRLNSEEKTLVINQRSLSQLVLPDIPQVGSCYADLKNIFTVDKGLIGDDTMRIASMTDQGKDRLQWQLIAYFVDRDRDKPDT